MNRWYRAYEGTVTDPKLGEVALLAECSRSVVIATWHAILESCASTQDAGRFDTNPRRIAAALCESVAVIERVFAGLADVGMIDDGVVCAWSGRQFESDNRNRMPAHLWADVRAGIFRRDDYTCQYCGVRGTRLECDHVIPIARGGSDQEINLVTACFSCNRSKRDKLLSEWRQ